MRILITNDDGIMAPGIQALYEAVADLGEVEVVAPETTQSAMGHGISVLTPMAVDRVHVNQAFHGWSVDGKPADCVKLALIELLEHRPDFVLSGINAGSNTGLNVLYSGTVAGAVEAAFFGIPAIAFSLQLSHELDFSKARAIARLMFLNFVESAPEPGQVLNVNIPALDSGWPRGVRLCVQGSASMAEHYHKEVTPDGRKIYRLDGRLPDTDAAHNSDLTAIREGYVSVTPLRSNMTCHPSLERLGSWNWPTSFEM